MQNKYWLGKKLSEAHKAKISLNRKGKEIITEEKRKERSKRLQGEKNPMKLDVNKEKIRQSKLGNKNPNWKGGIWKDKKYRNNILSVLTRNRRAKLKKAKGSFSVEEWEELKKKNNYKCLGCNKQEPEIKLTIDHIMPIFLGGTNFIKNIQPLCGKCNSKKGRKHPQAWSHHFELHEYYYMNAES